MTELVLKITDSLKIKKAQLPDNFEKMKQFKTYTKEYIENYTKTMGKEKKNKNKDDDKKQKGRLEILTVTITEDDDKKYFRYFVDTDGNISFEQCDVNINVKKPRKEGLEFEEKLAYLGEWIKNKGQTPKPGDKIKDFDVGGFYTTSMTNFDKCDQVNKVVDKLLKKD